jgi:hypothetical protein
MKQVKSVALIAALMLCALAGVTFADDSPESSFIVEQYGFRVQLPNESWSFEKPLANDVKAQLKHSQDPAQIRLQASENMKNHTERKLIEEYQKYQRKFDRSLSFDKNIATTSVNNRTWFVVNGMRSAGPFSIHFNSFQPRPGERLLRHFRSADAGNFPEVHGRPGRVFGEDRF